MNASLGRERESEIQQGGLRRPLWTVRLRRELQYALDLSALACAFVLAYLLRFEFAPGAEVVRQMLLQLPWVVLLQIAVLSLCGIYSFVWHFVGMAEIWTFVRAFALSFLPILGLRFGLELAPWTSADLWQVPLSVILMDGVLGFAFLLGLRVLRRSLYERYEQGSGRETESGKSRRSPRRTLLVGAGRAGVMAARELASGRRSDFELLGFLDDDPGKLGSVIQGLRVLGTSKDLEDQVQELGIEQVVLTMVEVRRETIEELIDHCRRLDVEVRIMPSLYEILDGRLSVSRFRQVQIEDLLGREPVRLDEEGLARFLAGRRVMVTGAGGSIGSELAHQVARFGPMQLVLVERSEPALFQTHRRLAQLWPEALLEPVLADVGQEQRMRRVLERYRPQLILHAAAHKHVPLMESNPTEALKNNVLATRQLGELAAQAEVERFVLISTDKAVRPSSMMGASKRMAELVIQDLDGRCDGTRFLAVRFGNVLGSAGSVTPIFSEQIERGGPVTVTHPDMVRYFMTIPEAAQLVLQAADLGEGGEIFVLDMGKPVRILDLAKDMIRLAGLEPDVDIEIQFTGPRPGEKLVEELGLGSEALEKTRHPKIFIGQLQAYPSERIREALAEVERHCHRDDGDALRRVLEGLLPEARLFTGDDSSVGRARLQVVRRPA